jgi:hypothetical protein
LKAESIEELGAIHDIVRKALAGTGQRTIEKRLAIAFAGVHPAEPEKQEGHLAADWNR